MALKAYVLIRVKKRKFSNEIPDEILKALKTVPEVKQVDGTTSQQHHIIAMIEVKDLKHLGEIVIEKIRGIDGVVGTNTCIIIG